MTQATLPMSIPKAPVKPAAPPPVQRKLTFGQIENRSARRIVLYGTGGIGKTELAAQAPGPVAFIDLDGSLPTLKPALEELGIVENIRPVTGINGWADLRGALNSDGWDGIKTIVIDTGSRAEDMCIQWVLENIKTEKGAVCHGIEDYGFGKGYTHVYETFMLLLSDLDRHIRAGRSVILICHDITASVPNPMGEDFIRYEPRLQAVNKSNLRNRTKEWADFVLFASYDVAAKDGKAKGIGTRTLYAAEMPHFMAKSRGYADPIPMERGNGAEVWSKFIINK